MNLALGCQIVWKRGGVRIVSLEVRYLPGGRYLTSRGVPFHGLVLASPAPFLSKNRLHLNFYRTEQKSFTVPSLPD